MADEVIGTSYLKVVPKMDMSVFKQGGGSIGNEMGERIGDGISGGISAKAVAIGSIVSNAVMGAVDTAVSIGSDIASGIYEGFATNEQLVGGMQKLFGDSAQTVIENANSAFMTAGKSANDYMSTVTSFSSSLINSLGGDTAAAADLAKTAMIDMSDNVNTFGTDAQSVQNAIIGLSRGNYTMLDNLSLGFAGTQQGMADLINESGVLGNKVIEASDLADVGFSTMLKAIHNVQVQSGIAGTTMNEAMGTLEGSATAASAAWENVLTSIGSGDPKQVQAAVDGLLDAVFGTLNEKTGAREGGVIENLVGLAQRSFEALGQALPGMVDSALSALPPEIGGPLREAFETIGEVATAVAPIVSDAIGTVIDVVSKVAPVVAPILPIIAGVMGAIKIVGVITSIVGAVTGFIGAAGTAIGMIGSIPGLIAVITTVLGGPVTIIAGIVGAIVAFIATNEDARNAVLEVWTAISEAVTSAVSTAVEFVTTKFNELKTAIPNIMSGIADGISNTWEAIKSNVSSAVTNVVNTVKTRFGNIASNVRGTFNKVKEAITHPIDTARNLIKSAIDKIKHIIGGVKLQLPHINLPHFSVSGGKAPWGIGGKGSMPSFSVKWFAQGGYVDQPTLFGGGERGGELIWPSYAPYLDRYADALAERIDGGGVNVYLTYNGTGDADELVRTLTRDLRMLRATGAI